MRSSGDSTLHLIPQAFLTESRVFAFIKPIMASRLASDVGIITAFAMMTALGIHIYAVGHDQNVHEEHQARLHENLKKRLPCRIPRFVQSKRKPFMWRYHGRRVVKRMEEEMKRRKR